jgi:formylaminopyrimidine deformylase / aminopyrimidine aminohydrolase
VDTQSLVTADPDGWSAAVRHPFLAGVRTGRLPVAAFEAWLVQDHLFVTDLLGFQARLLARAPAAARPVLLEGLAGLVAELGWFGEEAARRGVRLVTRRAPVTGAYSALLTELLAAPFAAGMTALWALEQVYLEAWGWAAPGAEPFRSCVEHWTTPEFAGYVGRLREAADAALAAAPDRHQVASATASVLALECRFWDATVAA